MIDRKDQDINDDGKLYMRWSNKRVNAAKSGITFSLTYRQFCRLVRNKNLVSSYLGFHKGSKKYVLARVRDRGAYAYGNCRFITQLENSKEKKQTVRAKLASRKNARIMNEANRKTSPEERSRRIVEGMTEYNSMRRERKVKKKKARWSTLHRSYRGNNNSQFGSFWITDGRINKKWRPELGKLPKSFHRGRVNGATPSKKPR